MSVEGKGVHAFSANGEIANSAEQESQNGGRLG